jgi:nucleoside-diphosphate-sugar epimerase
VPLAAEKGGIYNVCDTRQPSYGEISNSVAKQLGKSKPLSIPYRIAWCIAKFGDLFNGKFPLDSNRLHKMMTSSTLSNEKVKRELGWEPLDVIENYKI